MSSIYFLDDGVCIHVCLCMYSGVIVADVMPGFLEGARDNEDLQA